tara:strand:- start:1412 stop:1732 length:321 start_codon:yes stop_codon:yes gene_type:complete
MKIVQKIWAELSAQPKKVELAAMQDADALYNKLVKGAQAQASILMKVENELKSLSGTAQELQKVEQKLESMAKELGVDLDTNYEASTWVKDLSKYANEVGVISNKL